MCDKVSHEELSKSEVFCPFCEKQISEPSSNQELICCKKMNVIFDKLNVCKSCGVVHGAPIASEYIDFYDDMHKRKKKSVYYRKYHMKNSIIDIVEESGKQQFQTKQGKK